MAIKYSMKSPYELCFGMKAHCVNNLRSFGEMGMVTINDDDYFVLVDMEAVEMKFFLKMETIWRKRVRLI